MSDVNTILSAATTAIRGRFVAPAFTRSPRDPKLTAQQSFALTLGKKSDALDRGGALSTEQQARQIAEQLVASTFVQPMLKLFRDSNHAAPPFAPTPAEKQFGGLMDTELSQRIVGAKNFPIVETISQKLIKNKMRSTGGQDPKREIAAARRDAQVSAMTGERGASSPGASQGLSGNLGSLRVAPASIPSRATDGPRVIEPSTPTTSQP
jgi:Rod binding domain-containing protein